MAVTVAIHQPNFMPWLGWFDKIDRADVFVLLDCVQFIRRSVTTRVFALYDCRPIRLTVPIRHVRTQNLSIRDATIDVGSPLVNKMRKSLSHCYSRCRFWKQYGEPVLDILGTEYTKLIDLNTALNRFFADSLGIDWRKVRMQSDLSFRGRKSELMATLTLSARGDVYLSGGTAPSRHPGEAVTGTGAAYNDPLVYAAHGVALHYQNFVHPKYDQGCGSFARGLTVLDALVRLGPDTMDLVRDVNGRGRRPQPRARQRRTMQ